MSQPHPAAAPRDLDPWNGLFYTVADRLTPLFKGEGRGKVYARYAAGEAIAGYHPDSRADYATIGRILALSLATITAAEHASRPDLETSDLVRVLGKVHTLSQAADRAERSLLARRRQMQAEGVHRDALVPRPSGRPSRYAPLPADDPASGAARAAEAAQEAASVQGAQAPAEPAARAAALAVQAETVVGTVEANARQPEIQPAASTQRASPVVAAAATVLPMEARPVPTAKTDGLRMPETMPAALRAAIQSGHPPVAMAMVPERPRFPATPSAENAAVTAGPSF